MIFSLETHLTENYFVGLSEKEYDEIESRIDEGFCLIGNYWRELWW